MRKNMGKINNEKPTIEKNNQTKKFQCMILPPSNGPMGSMLKKPNTALMFQPMKLKRINMDPAPRIGSNIMNETRKIIERMKLTIGPASEIKPFCFLVILSA
jgi:hypothetical protein